MFPTSYFSTFYFVGSYWLHDLGSPTVTAKRRIKTPTRVR